MMESLPVRIARQAVEAFVTEGRVISPPEDLPDYLLRQAGVFVSLKERGALRGCIGTLQATQRNIAEEIVRNAISAATQDPRFPPVDPSELNELVYSVDVLSDAEKVPDESHLEPSRYGLIVQSGNCRGLLLPDINGVDSVEDQVCIAKRKAGIDEDGPCELYRFTVTRYT
jgi:AmmeMemoRadiSam system protein A